MGQDNTNRNLQKAVLQNKDFRDADFSGSDLRGADLTGSDLTGANLTNVKTGITPVYLAVIFIGAFVVSLLSGWVAAKASLAVHGMIHIKA